MTDIPAPNPVTVPIKEKRTILQNIKKEFVENPIRCTSSILASVSWIAVGFYFLSDRLLPQGSTVYIVSANLTPHSSPLDQIMVNIRFAYSGRSEVWAIGGYVVSVANDHSFTGNRFAIIRNAEGQPLPVMIDYIPKDTVSVYICTKSISYNRGKKNQAFLLEKQEYLSSESTVYQAHEQPISYDQPCGFFATNDDML